MINHTKLTHSLATVALVTTILLNVTPEIVNAQTSGGQGNVGFFQGLMQFIEQKFGLDKTQVQTAVQQYKTQHQASMTPRPTMSQQQMADREKSRLDKLVSSSKITADQEQAIITELASLQSKYNLGSMQSETPTQRKTTMQSMQSDLKAWAQSNNINPMYVMPFGGARGGHGMMRGRGGNGKWMHPSGSPTVTPTPGS